MTNKRVIFSGIFYFIIMVLLAFALYHTLTMDETQLTFTSLLEWFQNFHPVLPNVAYVSNAITGDWGLFEFLRSFLNLFIQVFDFALYAVKSFINILSYVSGLIVFMFTSG